MEMLLAIALAQFTGPDGQRIDVNSAEVTTIREPRSKDHFAPGTKCLIYLVSGNFITVQETCDEVRQEVGPLP
jgi:uncharacterized protein YlzI (FlbEa/FlbD family)